MSLTDRAPLLASQQEALRHLEIWASRAEDDVSDGAAEVEASVFCYTIGPSGALVAHGEAEAPPSSATPVRSAGDLEEFAMRAEVVLRDRRHSTDRAHHRRLVKQHELADAITTHAEDLLVQLKERAGQCASLRGETSELLSNLATQMRNLREQAALTEALQAQLAPLEDAKAVGTILDQHAWRDDAPHSPTHPLVRALATLDASARHLQAHAHWANSAVHLAQVNALRARSLRLVGSMITRPLEALTSAALIEMVSGASKLAAAGAQAAPPGGATAQAGSAGGAASDAVNPPTAGASGEGASGEGGSGEGGMPQVKESVEESVLGSAQSAHESLEMEVLYLRYRGLTGQLVGWMRELEARQQEAPELMAILHDVHAAYWRARRTALAPALRAALARIGAEEGAANVPAVVRACCAHTLRVCRSEHGLYLAFFPPVDDAAADGAAAGSTLESLMAGELESTCYGLYDYLRPPLLKAQSISPLCEVILICRTEVLPSIRDGGAACSPLAPLIERLLQDAQERLTFRVQTFVRDQIRNFRPSADDLSFPRAPHHPPPKQHVPPPPLPPPLPHPPPSSVAVGAAGTPAKPSGPPRPPLSPSSPTSATPDSGVVAETPATAAIGGPSLEEEAAPLVHANAAAEPATAAAEPTAGLAAASDGARPKRSGGVEDGWYATVSISLSCLAQLYRCVPRAVFEGLAQEILTECAESVERAAALIRARPSSSRLHGTLFSVSQLLVLREQIAPFETDFAITHQALDFSQTRQMVRTLVEKRGRLGGLSDMVELLQHAAPSIVRSQRDAKAALDLELRTACESFIRHCTDAVAKPLADVVAKLAAPTASQASRGASVPAAAGAEAVPAAITAAEKGVQAELREACGLMAAFLPEPSTRAILFAPIRSAILEALGQLQTILNALELAAPSKVPIEPERLSRLAAAVDELGGL